MVYIIILNWKGAEDTLACLNSLAHLRGVEYRLIICDNASPDRSYEKIRDGVQSLPYYKDAPLVELNREDSERYVISTDELKTIFLIQTGHNLGYAGGNNVGIRFAMNQADMQYVWLLNNDTEVEPDALLHMVQRCQSQPRIGICGSRLVYFHDRAHLQGLGGIYNRWLGTTRHYAAYAPSDTVYDDDKVSADIDYVIGASMLLTRPLLEQVGLLCEDYFLYFEELDIAIRSSASFKKSVATKSIVYHKEGGSVGGASKSIFADYCAIKNRLIISRKFYGFYFYFVWLSIFIVILNRIRRLEFNKAVQILKIFFGG